MRAPLLLFTFLITGCANILEVDGLSGPGVDPTDDDPDPTQPVPAMITITGTLLQLTTSSGTEMPLQSYPISLVKMPGRIHLVDGATDATGKYTLTAPTNGEPIDGHLEIPPKADTAVPSNGFPPTFIHFQRPLVADSQQPDLRIRTLNNIESFFSGTGEARRTNTSVVRMLILRENNVPAEGAVAITHPVTPIHYTDATSTGPNQTAFQTSVPGLAFALNASLGENTIRVQVDNDLIAPVRIQIFGPGENHQVNVRR